MTEPREVMDIHQMAAYLGISEDVLYRYAAQGKVPAFKLGNRWRFKRSLVDAWMVLESKNEMDRKQVYPEADAGETGEEANNV